MSVLTVSQLNRLLAFKLKSDLHLKGAAVKGELSNFKIHYKTGHAFFTIKDENSSIAGVMFAGSVQKMKVMPENGMQVLAVGNVEVYERDGACQIITSELTPIGGAGLLHKQNEIIKEKLRKQGVFDLSRKKKLPVFPKKLAVVTSLNGAALQDILNVTGRRYPVCEVLVFETAVQGGGTAASVVRALKKADLSGADVMILARGGGSAEDLAAFNTEEVVMAVAGLSTPVISAVGHETDTTLTDYAADVRAPTPSAAAELATPDREDMINLTDSVSDRLKLALEGYISRRIEENEKFALLLRAFSPSSRLEKDERRLSYLTERLCKAMDNRLRLEDKELEKCFSQLTLLSPFNVLSRGYAIVELGDRPVDKAESLSVGDRVKIRFSDGTVGAEITGISKIDAKG